MEKSNDPSKKVAHKVAASKDALTAEKKPATGDEAAVAFCQKCGE